MEQKTIKDGKVIKTFELSEEQHNMVVDMITSEKTINGNYSLEEPDSFTVKEWIELDDFNSQFLQEAVDDCADIYTLMDSIGDAKQPIGDVAVTYIIGETVTESNEEETKQGEKIYVVHYEEINDCELLHREIKVFRSEEKARKEFRMLVDNVKKDNDYNWTTNECDNYYETYPEGYYAHNHVMVELSETYLNE